MSEAFNILDEHCAGLIVEFLGGVYFAGSFRLICRHASRIVPKPQKKTADELLAAGARANRSELINLARARGASTIRCSLMSVPDRFRKFIGSTLVKSRILTNDVALGAAACHLDALYEKMLRVGNADITFVIIGAAFGGNLDICNKIIAGRADIEKREQSGATFFGDSMLFGAAFAGNLEICRAAFKIGVARSHFGLFAALYEGQFAAFKEILAHIGPDNWTSEIARDFRNLFGSSADTNIKVANDIAREWSQDPANNKQKEEFHPEYQKPANVRTEMTRQIN